jgi:hypothetical protein
MAGNSEPGCVAYNELLAPFEANYVRLVLGSDADATKVKFGLRLELFCRDSQPSPPSKHTQWSELLPLRSINWMGGTESGQVPRLIHARNELLLLRRLTELEDRLARSDRPKLRMEVADLHAQWLALLRHWGSERQGDFVFLKNSK